MIRPRRFQRVRNTPALSAQPKTWGRGSMALPQDQTTKGHPRDRNRKDGHKDVDQTADAHGQQFSGQSSVSECSTHRYCSRLLSHSKLAHRRTCRLDHMHSFVDHTDSPHTRSLHSMSMANSWNPRFEMHPMRKVQQGQRPQPQERVVSCGYSSSKQKS
jgi:hypothetical protein